MFKIFGSRGKAGDCKVQRYIHLIIVSWSLLYISMRQRFKFKLNATIAITAIVAHSLIQ
jgi:hypothetical protein